MTAENEEPQSINEASNGKDAKKWKQALEEEYNSLIKNEIWELVPPLEGFNVIVSKWVTKVKPDTNGDVDQHKARLCIPGIFTGTWN